MNISLKTLEEALGYSPSNRYLGKTSFLNLRLMSRSRSETRTPYAGRPLLSACDSSDLSAAAKPRWARLSTPGKAAPAKKKGELTPAGRKKLSQLMKSRWAARRKAAGTKIAPARKKSGPTPAGRKRLSQLMKARWAARRKPQVPVPDELDCRARDSSLADSTNGLPGVKTAAEGHRAFWRPPA